LNHEDKRQRQAAALNEPARDGGRAEQIEARSADPTQDPHEEMELPERADLGDEGEGRTGERHREHQHDAGAVPVCEGADAEARQTADHEIDRERGGDGAAAPPERLREDGQEDAVGGERHRHAAGDEEERGDDQPAAGGRAQRAISHQERADPEPTRSRA